MEGELLDDTLDAIHRIADARSHTGELKATYAEVASEVGAATDRVMTALRELNSRGAFLHATFSGGTSAGRLVVWTRRDPSGNDARGMLLNVLLRLADDLSGVDATAEQLRAQLPHLNLEHDHVRQMVRMLETEGAVEDLLRAGGMAGPDHKFMIRVL